MLIDFHCTAPNCRGISFVLLQKLPAIVSQAAAAATCPPLAARYESPLQLGFQRAYNIPVTFQPLE